MKINRDSAVKIQLLDAAVTHLVTTTIAIRVPIRRAISQLRREVLVRGNVNRRIAREEIRGHDVQLTDLNRPINHITKH